MKLRRLTLQNIGPFSSQPITFEDDVTVFTGANDTGKTSLLRAIQMSLSRSAGDVASESDVNFDHLSGCGTDWKKDKQVKAEVEFGFSGSDKKGKFNVYLAPDAWVHGRGEVPGRSGGIEGMVSNLPRVEFIRTGEDWEVRETIPLDAPNEAEVRIIRSAFGADFKWEAMQGLSEPRCRQITLRAEKRLNRKLKDILPPTVGYEFHFGSYADRRQELHVSLTDSVGSSIGLAQRGAGLRTLINLMGSLASENLGTENVLLLIDEPETHLHADAQHSLRRALEELGKSPSVQIVYATHSPCMINTMRPQSVRLLERRQKSETAWTHVDNTPFGAGFYTVRSSLGLSPADSLLYAPVTIIVEGKTEMLCLPFLFAKLFGDEILAQTIIIDGGGIPNLPNLARIAKTQGSKVICFVDGDNSPRWHKSLNDDHSDVAIVECVEKGEFEQIVPEELYFKTAHDEAGVSPGSFEEFKQWCDSDSKVARRAFSKKIERWFEDKLEISAPPKPVTMQKCIEVCELSAIQAAGLRELHRRIQMALV